MGSLTTFYESSKHACKDAWPSFYDTCKNEHRAMRLLASRRHVVDSGKGDTTAIVRELARLAESCGVLKPLEWRAGPRTRIHQLLEGIWDESDGGVFDPDPAEQYDRSFFGVMPVHVPLLLLLGVAEALLNFAGRQLQSWLERQLHVALVCPVQLTAKFISAISAAVFSLARCGARVASGLLEAAVLVAASVAVVIVGSGSCLYAGLIEFCSWAAAAYVRMRGVDGTPLLDGSAGAEVVSSGALGAEGPHDRGSTRSPSCCTVFQQAGRDGGGHGGSNDKVFAGVPAFGEHFEL